MKPVVRDEENPDFASPRGAVRDCVEPNLHLTLWREPRLEIFDNRSLLPDALQLLPVVKPLEGDPSVVAHSVNHRSPVGSAARPWRPPRATARLAPPASYAGGPNGRGSRVHAYVAQSSLVGVPS